MRPRGSKVRNKALAVLPRGSKVRDRAPAAQPGLWAVADSVRSSRARPGSAPPRPGSSPARPLGRCPFVSALSARSKRPPDVSSLARPPRRGPVSGSPVAHRSRPPRYPIRASLKGRAGPCGRAGIAPTVLPRGSKVRNKALAVRPRGSKVRNKVLAVRPRGSMVRDKSRAVRPRGSNVRNEAPCALSPQESSGRALPGPGRSQQRPDRPCHPGLRPPRPLRQPTPRTR